MYSFSDTLQLKRQARFYDLIQNLKIIMIININHATICYIDLSNMHIEVHISRNYVVATHK